jgi:hypothetical protein
MIDLCITMFYAQWVIKSHYFFLVTMRSNARMVLDHTKTRIVGLNTTRDMDIRSDYKWCERLLKFIGKNHSHNLY